MSTVIHSLSTLTGTSFNSFAWGFRLRRDPSSLYDGYCLIDRLLTLTLSVSLSYSVDSWVQSQSKIPLTSVSGLVVGKSNPSDLTPHELFLVSIRLNCSSSVCPGTHLADASIYIAIVKAVSGFSVSKAIGPDGKEIIPVAETTEGVIVYVLSSSKACVFITDRCVFV